MKWKLTSTTLFCDKVKKWVPIIVYGDGKTQCGYYYRHQVVAKENSGAFPCHGPQECELCKTYKQDVFSRRE